MAKRTLRSRGPEAENDSKTYAAGTESPADIADDIGAPGTPVESMAAGPSEEDIRTRAYHRFLERGGANGQDFDDWLEAERELKSGL